MTIKKNHQQLSQIPLHVREGGVQGFSDKFISNHSKSNGERLKMVILKAETLAGADVFTRGRGRKKGTSML